jgi:hypothetical protein
VVLVVCCCCDQKVQRTVAFFLSFSFGHLGSNIPFLAVAFFRRTFFPSFLFSASEDISPSRRAHQHICETLSFLFWRIAHNFLSNLMSVVEVIHTYRCILLVVLSISSSIHPTGISHHLLIIIIIIIIVIIKGLTD